MPCPRSCGRFLRETAARASRLQNKGRSGMSAPVSFQILGDGFQFSPIFLLGFGDGLLLADTIALGLQGYERPLEQRPNNA